jgi:hypothetical protein
MFPTLRLFVLALACLPLVVSAEPQQAIPSPARVTALDRYVAAPDPTFGWKVVRSHKADGLTATLLDMTSQRWLTEREVEVLRLLPS